MEIVRKPYPSDVSDEEWSLIAPYLTLKREDAGQREPSLREVFNGLRHIAKTGGPWRWMPNDLPPWAAVYQQTQRWLQGAPSNPAPSLSTAGHCVSRPRALNVRAMTTSAKRDPNCTLRSIRWTCSRCM